MESELYKMDDKLKNALEWVLCVVIAVVLAVTIRYYIGTPTIVKQVSMDPTLEQNDRLILNRWGRTTNKMPERGDIITFEAPLDESNNDVENGEVIANYSTDDKNFFESFVYNVLEIGKKSYIKRVIALPGEHVEIKDGAVYINGERLVEDYLVEGVITTNLGGEYIDLIVPENCVYALGDNRPYSRDCRSFGCIPLEKIESKVVIRFWPLSKFGKVE